MSKYGGTKEDMLAKQAALELTLATARAQADGAMARLTFDGVLNEINNRVVSLDGLAESIARARARGYVWAGDLEQKLQHAKQMAAQAQATARQETTRVANELRSRVNNTVSRVHRLDGVHNVASREQEVNAVASECSSLNQAIDAAERRVKESVGTFLQTVDALAAKCTQVHFTLDNFEKASFRMQPEENPILAVKATWEDSPYGEREGMLFFTAHRVRFEQHEEVVLERSFLFFASRTDVKRTLMLDFLIGQLASSDDTERGLMFKDQLLVFTLRPAQNLPQRATFELEDANAKEIDTLVEQLRAGDLQRQRYQGPMPTASNVGVPVRWPSKCENCGAALTPPVKGQTIIACDYCRTNHPVELGQG